MFSFIFIRNKFIYYLITDFIHDSYVFLNLLFIMNINFFFFLMRYRSGPKFETLNICVCVFVCLWAFGCYNL